MKTVLTENSQATMEFAQAFAKNLKGGEILALEGDLGSGKTTFTKGLAEALMVVDPITSPTFVLLKNYPAKIDKKNIEFVHVDAYRIESEEDLKSIGFEDFIGRDDVILVIEWADKIKKFLPKDIINIKFSTKDKNIREIIFQHEFLKARE